MVSLQPAIQTGISRVSPLASCCVGCRQQTLQVLARPLLVAVQAGPLLRHSYGDQISTNNHHASRRSRSSFFFSTWSGRGHDFLGDSFLGGARPKVLLEAIGPSGFDVSNLLKKIDPKEVAPHGALHMMGSIIAFPNACFLWKIEQPSDITIESLSPILLHRPKIEFVFIGTVKPMDHSHLTRLKEELKSKGGIVLEWLPLSEAMATFNILNGEDRMVATALVLDKDESNYVKDKGDD